MGLLEEEQCAAPMNGRMVGGETADHHHSTHRRGRKLQMALPVQHFLLSEKWKLGLLWLLTMQGPPSGSFTIPERAWCPGVFCSQEQAAQ